MSRKVLSVVLAFILIAGFGAFTTKADVTGSFSAKIIIQPIPCLAIAGVDNVTPPPGTAPGVITDVNNTCEDTLQKSDFETSLNINWTISGLTLGISSVAGFTGIEHILTSLQATLGALNISD